MTEREPGTPAAPAEFLAGSGGMRATRSRISYATCRSSCFSWRYCWPGGQADAQDLLQVALERAWRRRRGPIARDDNPEASVRRAIRPRGTCPTGSGRKRVLTESTDG